MDEELEVQSPETAQEDVEEIQVPSLTYQVTNGRIAGKIDEADAMRQAIEKILSTNRMQWAIYTAQYGHDLEELIGKEFPYVQAEVGRMITEALEGDDRVDSVEITSIEQLDSTSLHVKLTVNTLFGEITTETEVDA